MEISTDNKSNAEHLDADPDLNAVWDATAEAEALSKNTNDNQNNNPTSDNLQINNETSRNSSRDDEYRAANNSPSSPKRAKTATSADTADTSIECDSTTKENYCNQSSPIQQIVSHRTIPQQPSSIQNNDGNPPGIIVSASHTITSQQQDSYSLIAESSQHGPDDSSNRRNSFSQSRFMSSAYLTHRTTHEAETMIELSKRLPTQKEYKVGKEWFPNQLGIAVLYNKESGATFVYADQTGTWYDSAQAACIAASIPLSAIKSEYFSQQLDLYITLANEDRKLQFTPPIPFMEHAQGEQFLTATLLTIGIRSFDTNIGSSGYSNIRSVTVTNVDGRKSNHLVTITSKKQCSLVVKNNGKSCIHTINCNGVDKYTLSEHLELYSKEEGRNVTLYRAPLNSTHHESQAQRQLDQYNAMDWLRSGIMNRAGLSVFELDSIEGLRITLLTKRRPAASTPIPACVTSSTLRYRTIKRSIDSEDLGPCRGPEVNRVLDVIAQQVKTEVASLNITDATRASIADYEGSGRESVDAARAKKLAKSGDLKQYFDKSDGRTKKHTKYTCKYCKLYWQNVIKFDTIFARRHLTGLDYESGTNMGTARNPYQCTFIPDDVRKAIPRKGS